MGIKSITLVASTIFLSTNVNAALVTQGFLSTNDDGSSNIITDNLNDVEYLRLDVLADLTYAQTLAVLDTQAGGGWSIANATDAIAFVNALFGGTGSDSGCAHDGTNVTSGQCGRLTEWYDGKLGGNHTNMEDGADLAWFLDEQGEADGIQIFTRYEVDPEDSSNTIWYGDVSMFDYTIAQSDNFSTGGDTSISWLLTRETTVVPTPAAVWLFGSGLLGIVGVAKRKSANS